MERRRRRKKKRQSNRRKKNPPGYLVKLKCGHNHSPQNVVQLVSDHRNGSTNKGKARSEWVETFSPAVHGDTVRRGRSWRKTLSAKLLLSRMHPLPGSSSGFLVGLL